ncbi:hypothetical protein HUG10_06495 [Halorarum halophilum]|uniref:Uncharacterized protein n=1 Tax=Halorarum halophilum TaxID=2743090 RepID=A0A7D5GH12_9EURY|nr:hypothetical protein [Halobaculum halophilum]QLG27211.1 hypothetical protein HUG10_06495 [Halobaculum halophilum]
MVSSRTVTALVGLAISVAVSVVAWIYFDTLLVFLLVPFVPFLFRGRADADQARAGVCPECGFRTRDPEVRYCPRDGTELRQG